MSSWFHQLRIYLSFSFFGCHWSLSGESGPQFQSLHIQTCTDKLIMKTIIKWEENFEPTSWKFLGHFNRSLANTQATIVEIIIGDFVWNPSIESIEMMQWEAIAGREQVLFLSAGCTMPAMKTIVMMIHLPLECRHLGGLSFAGMDQSRGFPHTTISESGRTSQHSCQRDSKTSHNGWQ